MKKCVPVRMQKIIAMGSKQSRRAWALGRRLRKAKTKLITMGKSRLGQFDELRGIRPWRSGKTFFDAFWKSKSVREVVDINVLDDIELRRPFPYSNAPQLRLWDTSQYTSIYRSGIVRWFFLRNSHQRATADNGKENLVGRDDRDIRHTMTRDFLLTGSTFATGAYLLVVKVGDRCTFFPLNNSYL